MERTKIEIGEVVTEVVLTIEIAIEDKCRHNLDQGLDIVLNQDLLVTKEEISQEVS